MTAARQARGQSAAARQGVLVSYHHILWGGRGIVSYILGEVELYQSHYLYIYVVG